MRASKLSFLLVEFAAIALFFAGGDRDNLERVSGGCNQFGIQRVDFFQSGSEGCFAVVECGLDREQPLRKVTGICERRFEPGSQRRFFSFQKRDLFLHRLGFGVLLRCFVQQARNRAAQPVDLLAGDLQLVRLPLLEIVQIGDLRAAQVQFRGLFCDRVFKRADVAVLRDRDHGPRSRMGVKRRLGGLRASPGRPAPVGRQAGWIVESGLAYFHRSIAVAKARPRILQAVESRALTAA